MRNKVIKSGVWYTISNFVIKGIAFLTVPIFSRLLSKEIYGQFSDYSTWVSILAMIVSCNLYVSINRARFDFEEDMDNYCSSILIGGSTITCIFYLLFIALKPFFCDLIGVNEIYLHIMFIYLLFQPAIDVFQLRQRVVYKYVLSSLMSFVLAFLSTGLSVLFVLFFEDKFEARVLGNYLPFAIVGLTVFIYYMIKGKGFKWKHFKYAFSYSWPFIPHLLAMYILTASDKLIITRVLGTDFTAIYSISVSCVSLITLFLSSMNTAIAPWIFDKLKTGDTNKIKSITLPYCFLFATIIFIFVFLGPEILFVVGGEKYIESKFVLPALACGTAFHFAYCLYVNIEQYEKKTWAVATGSIIAATINIILNLIFIPIFGYETAAYTTLLGYIVLFIVHFIFVRIMGYKGIYHDKFVFIMLTSCVAFCSLALFLYYSQLNTLRYAVLLIVMIAAIIIVFIKKKNLIDYIKNIMSSVE